jgi:hypothetical protein
MVPLAHLLLEDMSRLLDSGGRQIAPAPNLPANPPAIEAT